MSTKWNTEKKIPFWMRRVDVPVEGSAAAEQRVEFNWKLVYTPFYVACITALLLAVVGMVAAVIGFSVSIVKAFPVAGAIALILVLFGRRN